MKKVVFLFMVLALPLVATACPYHQAAGILDQLDGLLNHDNTKWDFTRVGPDSGGLNHYQIQITSGGQTQMFQGHSSANAVVNDVVDFVEKSVESPTYKG